MNAGFLPLKKLRIATAMRTSNRTSAGFIQSIILNSVDTIHRQLCLCRLILDSISIIHHPESELRILQTEGVVLLAKL